MLDAGIDAPYSCLEGVCATCECKLVKGSVESAESAHAEGDRVLGCQVRPTTETVRVVSAEARRDCFVSDVGFVLSVTAEGVSPEGADGPNALRAVTRNT